VKSRANYERRQSSLDERLDPRWHPESAQPVLRDGRIDYEVSDRVTAIGCGGIGLLQTVVAAVGLRGEIDERLELLRRHLPYHESDHVMALTYNVLTGGRCLEDLELRRSDEGLLDALGARRIPDPTTAGDFLRRFDAAAVESLMDAVDASRSRVWRQQPQSSRRLALIDIDGTIVSTTGEHKERIDVSYDGQWGYVPLVVSLANSGEILSVFNRPANRPSHDGATQWINRAIDWALAGGGFERVRLRGDTDFSLTVNFDDWTARGVEFIFGMDASKTFVERAEELDPSAWKSLNRPTRKASKRRRSENVKAEVIKKRGFSELTLEEEHVAELEYQPRKSQRTYRLVVVRKRISVTKGQLPLADEIRYFFYVTNIAKEILGAAGVVRDNNARCHQENLIEQLKNGVQATRMPIREFDGNWAYLVIGALAWNLKAWCGLLLPEPLGARAILTMEFRRFLNEIILLPCQVVRTGRRMILRLLAINKWIPLLLEGVPLMQRQCCV
jgi:hypothetical protein